MRTRITLKTFVALALAVGAAACGSKEKPQEPKPEAPAKINGTPKKESELTTITLTAEAERRLGIRVEEARAAKGTEIRRYTGEVTKPVGSTIIVSAPVAGALQPLSSPVVGAHVTKDQTLFVINPFLPVSREAAISAEGEVAQAKTRVETARQRKARADRALADEVGTVRAQEEAAQELALAMTALAAAESRLKQLQSAPLSGPEPIPVRAPLDGIVRQVMVAPGQTLSAGAPMFEVEDAGEAWIRVPVYAGEIQGLAASSTVTVQAINGAGSSWNAQPVNAPPSADPAAATIHLYYRLPNQGGRFKPGEKVMVSIRGARSRNWIEVPWSAVTFDTNGGTWVYESQGERHYARRRVDVDHSSSGIAFLNAGISAGTKVVVEGVAELWGFEFGTGK